MSTVTARLRFASIVTFSLLCLIVQISFSSASAQTVTLTSTANNLYNTGYNGTALATGDQLDTHYVLTNFTSPNTYRSDPPQPLWVPNANTPGAQWISLVQAGHLNEPPAAFTFATFDYKLTLTNIPIGAVVTINGLVAADDNATVSVNGATPYFSNFKSHVVPGNFAAQAAFSGLTFVAGATNDIVIAVSNIGGGPTGLNLTLTGTYAALANTKGVIFTSPLPLTPNQNNVLNKINAINTVGSSNACYATLITALLASDPSNFGYDLDQLSPERLGIFSSIAFNDASFRTQNLDDYTAHRRNALGNLQVYPDKIDSSGLTLNDPTLDPTLSQINSRLLAWSPPRAPSGLVSDSVDPRTTLIAPEPPNNPANNWNFFVSGDVILGENLSQPELEHTNYTTSSFQMGTDYQIDKHWMIGALFNYGHTDTSLDEQGSSATVDSYSPGIFASFAQDGWFANALGAWSGNQYTEQRVINIGAFDRTANGATQGDEEIGNLDGGYEWHTKHWTYGPTLGLQYVHLNVNSFDENNGCSSDLSVDTMSDDSLRSRFGGHVSYEMFDHDNKVVFTPYIDASWQHEYLAGSQVITSSFHELGAGTFSVATPSTSRDSALLVTGLNADISDDMTLFSSYAVQVGESDYFGQSMVAGLKIAF